MWAVSSACVLVVFQSVALVSTVTASTLGSVPEPAATVGLLRREDVAVESGFPDWSPFPYVAPGAKARAPAAPSVDASGQAHGVTMDELSKELGNLEKRMEGIKKHMPTNPGEILEVQSKSHKRTADQVFEIHMTLNNVDHAILMERPTMREQFEQEVSNAIASLARNSKVEVKLSKAKGHSTRVHGIIMTQSSPADASLIENLLGIHASKGSLAAAVEESVKTVPYLLNIAHNVANGEIAVTDVIGPSLADQSPAGSIESEEEGSEPKVEGSPALKSPDESPASEERSDPKVKQSPVETVDPVESPASELRSQPKWAHQQQMFAGVYKLPEQPACTVLAGYANGTSDFGSGSHMCQACSEGCTVENKQPALQTSWAFKPALTAVHAFDLMVMVEFMHVQQMAPFSLNGVWHKMNVEVARSLGEPWRVEMGPQARGGVAPGDALNGKHVVTVSDTKLPSPDGSIVSGRWLALPSKRKPGDIGDCTRACVGCDDFPQLSASGLSTGTICTLSVGLDNTQAFVYRIRKSADSQSVEYDGATYMGTEWQVSIHDTTTGGFYVLGRFVLEGNDVQHGIQSFTSTHQHLGCAPCDAYYQAARVTGPFILKPQGVHQILKADSEVQRGVGKACGLHRAISLGGYSILYESGPGVWPARSSGSKSLFVCNQQR